MSQEIDAFLSGLGLANYAADFVAHGFDNMDRLKRMQNAHMAELGVKLGHRLQLQEALERVKMEEEAMKAGWTLQPKIGFNNPVPCLAQPDHRFAPLPFFPYLGTGMPMDVPWAPSWGFSSPCGWPLPQYPPFGGVGFAWQSSDAAKFPDKHIILTVGLVRLLLLDESVAGALPELVPFTRNGAIGSLCVEALEAASRNMQNKNFSAAQRKASAAVQNLTLAASTVQFPAYSEFIPVACKIAEYRYKDAKRGADAQKHASALMVSHNEFEKCDRSLRYRLFSAIVELKKTPKSCLQTLKHTLKTLVLLTCVDEAGGYLSRHAIDSVISHDFPRDRQISPEEEMDLRSSVWHCFHKVFADLPGAKKFKFKAKPERQQDKQQETDEEQPEVVFHSAEGSGDDAKSEPEPQQHEDGAGAEGSENAVQPGLEPQQQEQRITADPLRIHHDDGTIHWQDADTTRMEEAEYIAKPRRIRSAEDFDDKMVTQQFTVKNTFIDDTGPSDPSHAPIRRRPLGLAMSEPCHQVGPSSAGDPVCMEPVVEGQEDTPEDRILVISELNFTLVWRDYHGNYHSRHQCEGGLELKCGGRLYIRPGAKEFVAEMLQHQCCQLTFQSCSSLSNAQDMAKLLLQEAVPGEWVANAEHELPFFKGPDGQRVYLVHGKLASDVPQDFQEQGRRARVKYMDRVCDAFCKSGCFFNPSNTMMIDSTMGINSSIENLMQIDTWQEVNEDGTIFKELQEYLCKFFQSRPLPKVPAYFKEYPSKFHPSAGAASSEVAELNAAASNNIQAWKKMHVESQSDQEESAAEGNPDFEVLTSNGELENGSEQVQEKHASQAP
mmetsp:Transcript_6192/g.11236  ORF Transcript_6192/g.11236 Transcript_6192/m.11236 type:complete len:833 (+) Transcript_6192:144-2642(+)